MKLLIVSLITLSRVPLAGISCWQMFDGSWTWAWLAFIVCVSTDVVDGWLARKWQVATKGGAMADLGSDILIFWVYVPAVCWYNRNTILDMVTQEWFETAALLTFAVIIFIILPDPQAFLQWWKTKGNFWFGVIPMAIVGCWLAWQVSPVALGVTIAYGVFAIATNWKKVMKFI